MATINRDDILRTWTEGTGSGQGYYGRMFFFMELKNGMIYSKSGESARNLAEAKWHTIIDLSKGTMEI